MKKLREAGKLGAGRTVVVNGIGGLGSYAVQYARLLGAGATVVAFAHSDEKLAVARENGAHHTVNTRGKTTEEVQNALEDLTGGREVDAVLDCAGAEESLMLAASILARPRSYWTTSTTTWMRWRATTSWVAPSSCSTRRSRPSTKSVRPHAPGFR